MSNPKVPQWQVEGFNSYEEWEEYQFGDFESEAALRKAEMGPQAPYEPPGKESQYAEWLEREGFDPDTPMPPGYFGR